MGGGGGGTSNKKPFIYKVITYSNVAKHNFVVLCIVSCIVAIKLNNLEFKLLPFLLKDFFGLCGRGRSRDLVCIMLMSRNRMIHHS